MAATAKKIRSRQTGTNVPGKAERVPNGSYIPLKIRFQAWWEGVDAKALMRRKSKAKIRNSTMDIQVDQPVDDLESNKTDFELLMAIREQVWGKDLIVPGGHDYVRDFVAAANLKPGAVILDLAAGLGGGNRSIATALDAVVEGLEANEAVAKLGASRAAHLALEKQAPISFFLAHNPFLRVNRYDCAYGHEAFFRILDKKNLFSEIRKSLKEDGHFIFSDLVLASPEAASAKEISKWFESEKETLDPWSEMEYRSELANLGFEVVSFDDETTRYQAFIRKGWDEFSGTLDEKPISRRFVDIMMYEAKAWQYRMQALKSGNLKFIRAHIRRGHTNQS